MAETAVRLDQLPLRRPARVLAIAWGEMSDSAARRLRELGFDEGVTIEAMHVSPFGRDPIACRVGRMMVALRRAQAHAISVEEIVADTDTRMTNARITATPETVAA